MMKMFLAHISVLFSLVPFLLVSGLHGVTVKVTPDTVSSGYSGKITLEIGDGLLAGESVLVEQFFDLNGNGEVDPGDPLIMSFPLTDGEVPEIGGIVNVNVPHDLNPEPGEIEAQVSLVELGFLSADTLIRVSSPTGRFAPVTIPFTVIEGEHQQSISGVVRSGTETLAHALVALLDVGEGDGEGVAGAIADEFGAFSITAPPGVYLVFAVKDGYVLGEPEPVVLEPGESVGWDVEMAPAERLISGRLVDAGDSAIGLPGVGIFVESDDGFTLGFTDSEGGFSIAVGPGEWEIFASEDALGRLGYVGVEGEWIADTSEGDATGLVLAVPKATALFYGYLKDGDGNPIPGIEIFADSDNHVAIAFTDDDGYYVVAVVAGEWWIGPSSWDLERLGLLVPGTMRAIGDQEAMRVDFEAAAFTAYLTGRAVDQDGNPIADHGIFAADWDAGFWSHTETDDDGYFTIGVFAGTWRLELDSYEANARGLVYPHMVFSVTDGVDIADIIYVARTATATISGWVRESDGTPVDSVGIFASVTIDETDYFVWVRTDDEGNYSFGAVDGTWTVGVATHELEDRGFPPVPNRTVVLSNGDGIAEFIVGGAIPLPRFSSILRMGNGWIEMTLEGEEGWGYEIQATGSLTNPHWVHIGMIHLGPEGTAVIHDPDAPFFPSRFYRARTLP